MERMKLCALKMLNQICCPKKNLILTFILKIKVRACSLEVDHKTNGVHLKRSLGLHPKGVISTIYVALGHDISNFFKQKNKKEREENNKKMQKVSEAGVV